MIYSWEGEDLWEHSVRVAELGRCLFPDEVALYNKRVSELAGHSADWWLVTALLHDVGKAHKPFQKAPYRYFRCHEVYSAAFAYRALERYGDAAHVVATAVLLHHHAMERIGGCINIEIFDPVNEIREYAERISRVAGVKLGGWSNIAVREVLKTITGRKAYKIALIALMPLVVADNLAARSRGGELARLVRELVAEDRSRFERCLS